MSIDDRDEKIEAIRKSLSAGSKPKPQRKTGRASINIKGDQNIIGDGNVVHIHHRPGPSKRPVKTGDGVINAAQKSELKSLVDHLALLTEGSHAAIWSRFNRLMHVNSYHEIVQEQFDAAKAKLMQWRAAERRKSGQPMAKAGMIGAIQTRWKQTGTEDNGRAYMRASFGLTSLRELNMEQLQEVYDLAFQPR